MVAAIHKFMVQANRTQNIGVDFPGANILVSPKDEESQPQANEIAERISLLGSAVERENAELAQARETIARQRETVSRQHVELLSARERIEVLSGFKRRASVMGAAFARQDGDAVWLLGNRERGWSAFGFRYSSWEELARERPEVRACGAGVDEFGPYVEMRCIVSGVHVERVGTEE